MKIFNALRISSIRPSEHLANVLNYTFYGIYFLLVARFVIGLHEKPFEKLSDLTNELPDPFFILAIKRLASLFSDPFTQFDSFEAVILSLICYPIFHYGMFLKIPELRKDFFVNKILDACRAVFFLMGTLLILLVAARMGVMLYQDLTYGRSFITIGTPKKETSK
jgi:hypothetical protein